MPNNTPKDHEIKLRIDAPTVELIDRAKSYLGTNKSQFIRQSIREKAKSIIAAHEKTVFSQKDWTLFFDLLDNPPEPSKRFKKAALKHKKISHHQSREKIKCYEI